MIRIHNWRQSNIIFVRRFWRCVCNNNRCLIRRSYFASSTDDVVVVVAVAADVDDDDDNNDDDTPPERTWHGWRVLLLLLLLVVFRFMVVVFCSYYSWNVTNNNRNSYRTASRSIQHTILYVFHSINGFSFFLVVVFYGNFAMRESKNCWMVVYKIDNRIGIGVDRTVPDSPIPRFNPIK